MKRSISACLLAAFFAVAGCSTGTVIGGGDEPDGRAGGAPGQGGRAGATPGPAGSGGQATAGTTGGGSAGAAGGPPAGMGGASQAGAGASGQPAGAGGGSGPDAGVRMDAATDTGGPQPTDDPPPGQVPAIIGVGYGGIRVVSTDDGANWVKRAQLAAGGGDDNNLLRCVTWGRGVWLTGGWQVFTSSDGKAWTKRTNPPDCGLMQGCAYGNGRFVATCGESSWVSPDAVTWTKGSRIGSGGHTAVRFGGGKFAAWGDSKLSFLSTDGITWTRHTLPDVNFCDGAFKSQADCGNAFRAPGLWIRSEWRAKIVRSTTGSAFQQVYVDDANNTADWYAWGYVAK